MPLLALTLFILNNRKVWMGEKFRSKIMTNVVLVLDMLFFGYIGYSEIAEKLRLLIGQ